MVDLPFLIVIAVTLAFMSVLVAFRMHASGAATVEMVTVIAELWAVFAIWIAVLATVAGGGGWSAFVRRFGGLSAAGRALTVVAVVVSVGLFVHLQWTLRRAMQGGGGGDVEGE
jgi:hypothetical protein